MAQIKQKVKEKLDQFGFILCKCGHSVLQHDDGLSVRGSICYVVGCDCKYYRADREFISAWEMSNGSDKNSED